jgi:uncharacterized protein YjdB
MPPKAWIEKSLKFESSDESVATVAEDGKVTVLDATPGKEVTISAKTYATTGSTREKKGEANRSVSYTLKIVAP